MLVEIIDGETGAILYRETVIPVAGDPPAELHYQAYKFPLLSYDKAIDHAVFFGPLEKTACSTF